MRFRTTSLLLAAATTMFTTTALAQDEEGDGFMAGWTGKGEFGLVKTTGNTDSEALNFNLEFIKESELWRHRMFASALTTSEDGEKDNERYQLELQSDRKLDEKSYIFGAFRWDADKFGAYDPQMTLTAGYGRELMSSERHTLKGEIGGGYRDLEERETGVTSSEAIVRFLLDDTWTITDNTEWVNRLLVESGSDNTFSQFNTGLNVAMNSKFAIKVGFEARNNTKVPPGDSEKTDTKTTVNLVYNF
jgi:putative salt-induced outer membrane protein